MPFHFEQPLDSHVKLQKRLEEIDENKGLHVEIVWSWENYIFTSRGHTWQHYEHLIKSRWKYEGPEMVQG